MNNTIMQRDYYYISGFLTDDLVTAEENGNQKKYLGVCKLPGEGRKVKMLSVIFARFRHALVCLFCGRIWNNGQCGTNCVTLLHYSKYDKIVSSRTILPNIILQTCLSLDLATITITCPCDPLFQGHSIYWSVIISRSTVFPSMTIDH